MRWLHPDLRFPERVSPSGFTLVEILVVMSIIGVLVGLVGGNYITSRLRARDAERKNSLVQITKALELYFNDYNKYPEAITGRIEGIAWGGVFIDSQNTIYMKQIPLDRQAPARQYLYETNVERNKYRLYARLENEQDLDTDLNGDGVPGDEFDGSVGDGSAKVCGARNCNYAIVSPNTNVTEAY